MINSAMLQREMYTMHEVLIRMPGARATKKINTTQTKRGWKPCVQRASERARSNRAGSGVVIRGRETGGVSTAPARGVGGEDGVDIESASGSGGSRRHYASAPTAGACATSPSGAASAPSGTFPFSRRESPTWWKSAGGRQYGASRHSERVWY